MPKASEYRGPVIIAFTIALATLLIWPTWIASRNGLSDLHARPAIDYLETRRFDAHAVSESEWQSMEQSVAHADRLMPRNPQYLEALGWLNQLKLTFFADRLTTGEMNAHAATSQDYFHKAVENRPTWPYYWGNLALEYYRRGNFKADDYSRALANASRFGPWKNDMQRLVIDLGGETWEFLSRNAKHEYIFSAERALHRQPQNTVRIVRNHDAWPILCEARSKIADVPLPHLRALCAETGLTDQANTP